MSRAKRPCFAYYLPRTTITIFPDFALTLRASPLEHRGRRRCRGSKLSYCGDLRLLVDLCGAIVLVDQPAEDRLSPYPPVLGKVTDCGRWAWRRQIHRPMRPAFVVVLEVLDQDVAKMSLTEDEHPVGEFAA